MPILQVIVCVIQSLELFDLVEDVVASKEFGVVQVDYRSVRPAFAILLYVEDGANEVVEDLLDSLRSRITRIKPRASMADFVRLHLDPMLNLAMLMELIVSIEACIAIWLLLTLEDLLLSVASLVLFEVAAGGVALFAILAFERFLAGVASHVDTEVRQTPEDPSAHVGEV